MYQSLHLGSGEIPAALSAFQLSAVASVLDLKKIAALLAYNSCSISNILSKTWRCHNHVGDHPGGDSCAPGSS